MPYELLIPAGVLYLAAKLMEKQKVAFYWAALFYVLAMLLITALTPLLATAIVQSSVSHISLVSLGFSIGMIWSWSLQYIVAAITLYLLDRHEDTIANWLVIFVIGYLVLAFVI